MSLESKVDRVKQAKVKVSKVNVNWPFIGLMVVYLAALVISGLDQFISAGFDFSLVGTAEWWYKVFQSIAINNLILLGTLLYLLDKMKKCDADILKWNKTIEDAVEEHIDPNTFDEWLSNFNLNRKIKLFKNAIMNLINKLDEKVKPKSIELWIKYRKDVIIEENKPPEERKKVDVPNDKYCIKKYNLLQQVTDEYINERIHYLKIGYKPKQKSFVTNGYTSRNGGSDDYYTESSIGKMSRDLLPRIILTIGYLLAFNTIRLELLEATNWKVATVAIAMKVLPMIMQIFVATSYAKQFKIEKILVDFRVRYEMITLYVASLLKPKAKKEVTNG